MGVQSLPGAIPTIRRSRQIGFRYQKHDFKIRYSHSASRRGGIEIVEVLSGRGAPEGTVVLTVTNLLEAEQAYRNLRTDLDAAILLM
jgi:hypothetical protein